MGAKAPASRRSGEQTDERLLIEAAQKDPGQFAGLYDLHFERVYGFVARRVQDRDAAEDLTSDVFHKALASLKQFEWLGAPFAAWLLRIAANAITDRAKRTSREVASIDDPDGIRDDISAGISAESAMEDVEHQAQLFRMVNDLPGEQRRVVVMRFAEEKSIREIAQALGKSEGAVKQLQFRGLEALRAQCDAARVRKPRGGVRKTKRSGGKNG
jgi:RNA polymerase sigma-70 factor (ECF subfamily)